MQMQGKEEKSQFRNTTPIERVLEASKDELGSIDIIEPIRVLKRNWIDNIRDLRLVYKEGQLSSLVRIPESLLKWLAKQCNKQFRDDHEQIGDGMVFEYQSDLDKNGIVYYIGTSGGSQYWKNPGLTGLIRVYASSLMHDSAPATAVLGKEAVRCVTKPEKNSWFVIDFARKMICPTAYTLRHYSTWDTEALRTWQFSASVDGLKWDIIKKHRNDTSLNMKGAAYTWRIDNCQEYYCKFKILQTDFNSNRHYYLALSGFEIYGTLKERDQGASNANIDGLKFNPAFDFDTKGILYWLGTNKGKENWLNPVDRGLVRVYQSSLAKDSHPAKSICGRDLVRCVTAPKKSSWFMIDLLNVQIIPTHYTIKHYSSFDTECLRNWRLEGSSNSTNGLNGNWITLMTHNNDQNLNCKGATHTWQLPQINNEAYSKFRIFQFGVNSNQHHYLACSGFELYGTVINGNNRPNQVRPDAVSQPKGPTRNFIHAFHFDTNGLLYFLGTQGGKQPWMNPVQRGLVEVKSSSLMSDSQPLSSICGRVAVRCVTKPHQKSWMLIHLKDVKIKLTKYSLRHYNSWDTEALRYWNLEGSNDGISWVPLRQHLDDRSLRKSGMPHTWSIDTSIFYSYFRIYMTGRNSNNHWYLACSGLELYGLATGGVVSERANARIPQIQLQQQPPMAYGAANPLQQQHKGGGIQSKSQAQSYNYNNYPNIKQIQLDRQKNNISTFIYKRDFDGYGIVYWLATSCGTNNWMNPVQLNLISIRSSGFMHDSSPPQSIVGLESVRCVTKPIKHAWIVIDFKDYAIKPSAYTLRHYSSWDTEALRNWRFEGSCDGDTWNIIKEHRNDSSLNFKGQSYTWYLKNVNQYYQMFRIFQFDKNSNQHYYLACSGFEIYGDVVRTNPYYKWSTNPRYKSKFLAVDVSNNRVTNIGSKDAWQTVKANQPFNFNQNKLQEFSILIEKSANTTNSWKFMVGIAPLEFNCQFKKQWLGSQNSWGYIAGTGGKCHKDSKSIAYGLRYGLNDGDLITCVMNAKNKSLEFLLNNKSQGKAFDNINYKNTQIFAAVSITATNSRLKLVERVSPFNPPILNGVLVQPQQNNVIIPKQNILKVNKNNKNNFGWDTQLISKHLMILPDGVNVTNKGSNDTWQGVVSTAVFSSGKHSFTIEIVYDAKTTNSWKFVIGVVPVKFDPRRTAWIGSQGSWGYIGGTGGKVYNVGESLPYSKKYGGNDKIRCDVDFNKCTIEFFINNKSCGIAFKNLNTPVKPAVSLTGKGACVKITNVN